MERGNEGVGVIYYYERANRNKLRGYVRGKINDIQYKQREICIWHEITCSTTSKVDHVTRSPWVKLETSIAWTYGFLPLALDTWSASAVVPNTLHTDVIRFNLSSLSKQKPP